MTCYKDRTFCIANCSTTCAIKLTPNIVDEAKAFGLPVAQADMSKVCSDYVKVKELNGTPKL